MVSSPKGLGPEKDCAGKDQKHIQKTDPTSRQRGRPTRTRPQLSDSNKNLVVSPRWVLYSKTHWPTDMTLTLTLTSLSLLSIDGPMFLVIYMRRDMPVTTDKELCKK
jgi:hypothetical protein